MEDELKYEVWEDSGLPCVLCGDEPATIVITRYSDPNPNRDARAVCCECVSCLVSAGLQGAVHREMSEDRSDLVTKQ